MVNTDDVKKMVIPLWLIFHGLLIVLIDATCTREGPGGLTYRFDFINDSVGMILITIAMFQLGRIWVDTRYSHAMKFVKIAAIIGICQTLLAHIIVPNSRLLFVLTTTFIALNLVGAWVFCTAMIWLSNAMRYTGVAGNWKITRILIAYLYAAPLAFIYIIGPVLDSRCFILDINVMPLSLIKDGNLILLIPVISFFYSLIIMIRHAGSDKLTA